ncbi:peptidase domain-containing ABC transporter [Pedobacter cryoconitis]|uniref:peptidase domain-containing ABC transporter n=1 Tax=Pedobacter cryoconitis TaxID=188932 RepID=UPI0016085714|nr:peptidase domain-containing ABC transporter [Pedobacter cryoconitis]MBB5648194.1 ATP-binding cassette subfamily B protein [Pedobacter cryoconitis]
MLKFYFQYDQMDCGAACLAMISSYHGKDFGLQYLRSNMFISREGVSLLGISDVAVKIGFTTVTAKLTPREFKPELLPCILHWKQNHFVVLYKISKDLLTGKMKYKIADPAHGWIWVFEEKFLESWCPEEKHGVSLFLEPTEKFHTQVPAKSESLSAVYLFRILKLYKRHFLGLSVFMLLSSLTMLVLPILMQKLIDEGVVKKDLQMITYILLAQLSFFLGNIIFDIFRNRILLFVGNKINIQIISEFLTKLLSLPIRFFDTKLMGDFNQRIQDHERIEQFLTSQALLTVFSMVSFSVFFGVLWYYDHQILLVYLILTTLSVVWSLVWLKKRKVLDYSRFHQRAESQESIYEIINGVSEMKLNQFEIYKRNEWEKIQQKLYKVNTSLLKLDQIQLAGFEFLNQLKNIIVTFLTASFVVNGDMTIGTLLSVSYIIGQMNSPVNQLVNFFRSLQDAKLSLSRLNEVHLHDDEEKGEFTPMRVSAYPANDSLSSKGININKLFFQFEGPKSPFVLEDVSLFIPDGKITAIVGASGSGKTTLMKLLIRFYDPTHGTVCYDDKNMLSLSPKSIREHCGVVMQDGYIFSDTIERNIATGDENIDREKLLNAVRIANIGSFIDSLPLGFKTKIGAAGNGISGGQKQRILIARAVYKNPYYIFFDEATSALDAENEKIIHDNLQSFFRGKTVLIIAHRLSTVKNADQIIVLKHGTIIERGSHSELVAYRNEYYNLVKNQLELD